VESVALLNRFIDFCCYCLQPVFFQDNGGGSVTVPVVYFPPGTTPTDDPDTGMITAEASGANRGWLDFGFDFGTFELTTRVTLFVEDAAGMVSEMLHGAGGGILFVLTLETHTDGFLEVIGPTGSATTNPEIYSWDEESAGALGVDMEPAWYMAESDPDLDTVILDVQAWADETTDLWTEYLAAEFLGYYFEPPAISNTCLFSSSNVDPAACNDDPDYIDPVYGENCVGWREYVCHETGMSRDEERGLRHACPVACGMCHNGATCPAMEGSSSSDSMCRDSPAGWRDSYGETCQWFEGTSTENECGDGFPETCCEKYGGDLGAEGLTVNQACCACGGGTTGLTWAGDCIDNPTYIDPDYVPWTPSGCSDWRDFSCETGGGEGGLSEPDVEWLRFYCPAACGECATRVPGYQCASSYCSPETSQCEAHPTESVYVSAYNIEGSPVVGVDGMYYRKWSLSCNGLPVFELDSTDEHTTVLYSPTGSTDRWNLGEAGDYSLAAMCDDANAFLSADCSWPEAEACTWYELVEGSWDQTFEILITDVLATTLASAYHIEGSSVDGIDGTYYRMWHLSCNGMAVFQLDDEGWNTVLLQPTGNEYKWIVADGDVVTTCSDSGWAITYCDTPDACEWIELTETDDGTAACEEVVGFSGEEDPWFWCSAPGLWISAVTETEYRGNGAPCGVDEPSPSTGVGDGTFVLDDNVCGSSFCDRRLVVADQTDFGVCADNPSYYGCDSDSSVATQTSFSDGLAAGTYVEGYIRSWTLMCEPDSHVQLQFTHFNTEPDEVMMRLYDGDGTSLIPMLSDDLPFGFITGDTQSEARRSFRYTNLAQYEAQAGFSGNLPQVWQLFFGNGDSGWCTPNCPHWLSTGSKMFLEFEVRPTAGPYLEEHGFEATWTCVEGPAPPPPPPPPSPPAPPAPPPTPESVPSPPSPPTCSNSTSCRAILLADDRCRNSRRCCCDETRAENIAASQAAHAAGNMPGQNADRERFDPANPTARTRNRRSRSSNVTSSSSSTSTSSSRTRSSSSSSRTRSSTATSSRSRSSSSSRRSTTAQAKDTAAASLKESNPTLYYILVGVGLVVIAGGMWFNQGDDEEEEGKQDATTEDNPVAAPRPAPRPPGDDNQLYDQIDTDGSGELSLEEVVAAIGTVCTFCSANIPCWFPHLRSPC
jgi:hypothetical protein